MKKEYILNLKSLTIFSVSLCLTVAALFAGWQENSYSAEMAGININSMPDLQGERAKEFLKRHNLFNSLNGEVGRARAESAKKELAKTKYPPTLNSLFSQNAKLTANDGASGDGFGFSVSISGNTAVVGSPGDDNDKGAVYVFVKNGTDWTQQAKLTAGDGVSGDVFGFSVSISNDTLIVGTPNAQVDNRREQGAAYIFVRNNGNWTQQAKLISSDANPYEYFGISVSISNNTAVVGNALDGFGLGAAFVFVRNAASWTLQAKLTASDGNYSDQFGYTVSISNNTVIVGAPVGISKRFQTGVAYIFVRNGTSWTQQAKIAAGDGESADRFGFSVSVSNETAIIGAYDADFRKGSAYIFVRNSGNWTQQAKITPDDNSTISRFGISVSISDNTVVVGAVDDDNGRAEDSAFVFVRNGTSWTQQDKLLASDGGNNDIFGFSVAISDNVLIAGAPLHNNFQGAAYIFAGNTQNVSNENKFDFDGDGRADISVFRPSNGAWYLLQSSAGFSGIGFGISSDLIVPADFDGDGKTDIAVFRPSNGAWYILNSSTGGFVGVGFGQSGDIPLPADFDGDGKADINVFRPSNGAWYRLNSSNGQFVAAQFGSNGDIPLAADFDGDGKADVAVFRPANGTWYYLNSSTGQFVAVRFGINTDKPTPADFDGDGKTDISVFRPETGSWYRLNSSTGQFVGVGFGIAEDKPVAADFDGDGMADIAVFRPSSGVWYLLQSQNGFTAAQFGTINDKPVPAAFIR